MSKEERKQLLTQPYKERLEKTKEIIETVLSLAKHPVIQFSGGADSCVMADIIHKINPKVPLVFNDWGLFLPEQEEFCKKFAEKYGYQLLIARSGIEWNTFLPKNGFPLFKGVPFIPEKDYKKYNISKACRNCKDRCNTDLKKQYPFDYFFVGVLADESGGRKSRFVTLGFTIKKSDGTTLVKPIALLTKEEVFQYLKDNKIIYPEEYYRDEYHGKLFQFNHCDMGCFMCGIRLEGEGFGRIGRLARTRPDLWFRLLDLGLRDSLRRIIQDYPLQASHLQRMLEEYDAPKVTGYDLDGVISVMPKRWKPFFEQTKTERQAYEQEKLHWFMESPVLWEPKVEGYIVTGRREKYRKETEAWLTKNSIKYKKLYMMPTMALTFKNIVGHKIKMIRELGIQRYFEDDPELVKGIKKALPEVEVVEVKRTEKSYKIISPEVYKPLEL